MVTLTPLSKGLIGLAVIGAVASAIWHLALKDTVSEWTGTPPATTEAAAPAAVVVPTPAPEPPPAAPPVIEPPKMPPSSSPAAEPPSAPPAVSPKEEPIKEPENHLSPAESSERGRKLMDSGNYADARRYLEQAVKGGDGAAACLLGEMTLKGLGGIEASHDKAASLFQIAQSKNIICFASGR